MRQKRRPGAGDRCTALNECNQRMKKPVRGQRPDQSRPPDCRQARDFVPVWSAVDLARLERVARENAKSLLGQLAKVQLYAAAGKMREASARVGKLYDKHAAQVVEDAFLYQNFVQCFIALGQINAAAQIVNTRIGIPEWCAITFDNELIKAPGAILWNVHDRRRCTFKFSRDIYSSQKYDMIINNWLSCLPALAAYHSSETHRGGEVALNVDDHGVVPGLAFCDYRPNFFLIPDPQFQSTHGYSATRSYYESHDVPWSDRVPLAFWRGATTGRYPAPGKRDCFLLPRVRLCSLTQSRPDLFDVGLNQIVQISNPEDIRSIEESGLMRPTVPDTTFNQYRYQIDIDGNSNSWAGLFTKLLTGSPVLKVASPLGFRQWYYDLLEPWVNFVPVASDMSDLIEKTEWLRDNAEEARRIGERGRETAAFLAYDAEIVRCSSTLVSAFSFFS